MEIKVVEWTEKSLSGRPRYVITDAKTGQVLDDAYGYGYRSFEKAEKAWMMRHHKAPATIEEVLHALDEGSWEIVTVQIQAKSRYVIKDAETGQLLDDAKGCGYTSYSAAYRGWMNQNREFFEVKRRSALRNIAWLRCWAAHKMTTKELGPEPRIVIVDTRNNKIVDDAFGMGYKTKRQAGEFMRRLQWEMKLEGETAETEKGTP